MFELCQLEAFSEIDFVTGVFVVGECVASGTLGLFEILIIRVFLLYRLRILVTGEMFISFFSSSIFIFFDILNCHSFPFFPAYHLCLGVLHGGLQQIIDLTG